MPAYQLRITEPAEADIDAVFHYLLLRSPESALRFRDQIDEAIDSLIEMPLMYPVAPELISGRVEVRQMLVRFGRATYRILFAVREPAADMYGRVIILRVRHGSQRGLGEAADP